MERWCAVPLKRVSWRRNSSRSAQVSGAISTSVRQTVCEWVGVYVFRESAGGDVAVRRAARPRTGCPGDGALMGAAVRRQVSHAKLSQDVAACLSRSLSGPCKPPISMWLG